MSFFFFNTGVQTVMLMAVVFAKKEINWGEGGGDSSLIVAILLIQILGAAGAYLMSFISGLIGKLKTLIVVVVGWMLLCIWAYWVGKPFEFYLLDGGIGWVWGGVHA